MQHDPAVEIQRKYYTETAGRYGSMHTKEGAGDPRVLEMIVSVVRSLGVQSWLDVGSGDGRGLTSFAEAFPGALVCGAEPVAALIQQAVAAGVSQKVSLIQASGEALPFPDCSFDVVSEFSILHHVPDPRAVVKEMTRVARKAVVIGDSNRFGQGVVAARWIKLMLYKFGLWRVFNYVRTGGKHYQISEGDGVFWSYSVFDTFDVLGEWADRLLIYTDRPYPMSWFHPLLTAQGMTMIAIRDRERKEILS